MPKVDLTQLPTFQGADAAAAYGGDLGAYLGRAISGAMGLAHLGANVETLMPGASSSHRHWHDRTDEIVVVLSGTLVLVEEDGAVEMGVGEIAVFPAGVENGHCLQNRSSDAASFLVVGSRDDADRCHYSDLDLVLHPDGSLTRKDGSAPST
ncbi:cupin domain-containing protein [Thalassococcus sp. S3]|uniref:cupin domain-containing protein n=1 Tax=Thalassococcus sp. S3 TaxID=2017482 RepID=UPI0010248C9F|nr:cupin domain-containing protein [Thalassococcus sp. S3]QBF30737.1 hypothetical protein CFI11_05830 [Thalassococcus sp. S3]